MLQKPESVKLILFFGGIPGMNTDWQKNSLRAALWWTTWGSGGGKADNFLLCHQFKGLVTLQGKVLLWKINFSCEYLGSSQVPWMWFCRLLTCSSLVWSLLSCISEQTLALSRICAVESHMKRDLEGSRGPRKLVNVQGSPSLSSGAMHPEEVTEVLQVFVAKLPWWSN